MGHMQRSMEQMQTGNREYRITKEFESNEFIVLKDAFNRLMDEIMKLKKLKLRKTDRSAGNRT